MVELTSGYAKNSENISMEIAPGTDDSSNGSATSVADLSNTESTPFSVTPPVTRARAASIPNAPAQSANLSGTEGTPSSVTPSVTRDRAATTTPNASASVEPLTATRTTPTPPPWREKREADLTSPSPI
ncbi:ponticulin-like protein H [Papaver somniferum]|uniref:ponticulin-like protein H n=1 Tax=Papaver somniferum TaxID=3469 RepID=UPI000E704AB3|nr:ponticulin-like protein H [Papaver somniferum]